MIDGETVAREPSTGQAGFEPAGPCRLRGYGLVELLLVLAMATVLLATAVPRLAATLHEHRLRGAAIHLRGLFRQVRARAAAEARYIGVVFDEVDGDPVYSIYADGNANGIRRADIRRGIDVRIREPYSISETFPGVRYGSLPAGAEEPFFPGLRIGRSKIVSFSPIGASTSGTVFLSNQYEIVYCVVVLGSTSRVRIARYRGNGWESM